MILRDFAYRYASVPTLSAALRQGAISSREATQAALALASDVGRRYGAVASLMEERALEDASHADRLVAQGRASDLTGIPYGAKDVIAAAGAPTTWGVPSMLGRVLTEDATVVRRLADHHSVLVAKLVTTSLAGGGGHRIPGISAHGQPTNPWDVARFAGSSSSGSAIAVAHGVVPFALGTETGGSVIQPAAFCGVTGYRPTFGRIPRSGVMTLSRQLDKVGVIARTAEDCAIVGAALSGPDTADRYSSMPASYGFRPALNRARMAVDSEELETVSESMRNALSRGLDEIGKLVGKLLTTQVASDREYGNAIELLIRVDAAYSFRELLDDPEFRLADPNQLDQLRSARRISAVEYSEALRKKQDAEFDFRLLFQEADLLVTASYPTPPQPRSKDREPRGSSSPSARVLAGANLAGLPGVTLPCGLDLDGLPVGLHVVGPTGSDELLLELGIQFQARTGYHLRHPSDSYDPAGAGLGGKDAPSSSIA